MRVLLRKLGKGRRRAVSGTLAREPIAGSSLVITFPDGRHEFITTPVQRVFHVHGAKTLFLETANSRYRLDYDQAGDDLAEALQR